MGIGVQIVISIERSDEKSYGFDKLISHAKARSRGGSNGLRPCSFLVNYHSCLAHPFFYRTQGEPMG